VRKTNQCRTEGLFERSILCLAPMAGYTDAPFRLLCFEFGADFTISGMVNARGLVRSVPKTRRLLRIIDGEGPVGVQLFGSEPEVMARAAAIAMEAGPAFIDLNFGCPVRKVIRRNSGVAVMRDLELMGRICREVVKGVNVPVSAKIRSGWSSCEENYLEAGKVLQDSGISAVTLHPRYRTQGFSGSASWEHIAELKRHISIPVIANGDVRSLEDYREIVQSAECRTVMIGRGAFGRPWIFKEIRDKLGGEESSDPPIKERINILERHARMEVHVKGERLGILEMRKHYRWYLGSLAGIKDYRRCLAGAGTLDEVVGILNDLREVIDKKWKKSA
jgi:tRNA-dihydrouridine synthase B